MSDYGTPPPSYDGMPPAQPPTSEPPSNNLVWAILTTIFCCLPLGVVSIVFAAQVNSKWQAGDYAGAQDASRKAKQWAIWSAVAGVVVAVLYVVLALVVGLNLPTTTTGY